MEEAMRLGGKCVAQAEPQSKSNREAIKEACEMDAALRSTVVGGDQRTEARCLDSEGSDCFISNASQNKAQAATSIEIRELLREQLYACGLCGVDLIPEYAHLDHRVPRSDGGDDTINNLQWLCADCNLAKGSMREAEFVRLCKRIAARNR